MPDLPDAKDDLVIKECRIQSWESNMRRTCLSVNLPLCFVGATPPRPDPSHPLSSVRGVVGRFGYKPPRINRVFLRKFRRFVHSWLRKNLRPLDPTEIPDFEEWLSSCDYIASRKEELRKVWQSFQKTGDKSRFGDVKSFIKDESYPSYKNPRIINSRVDVAKCFFGPVVQAVSDRLFSLDWFIKTVPVPDRPVVIRDHLLSSGSNQDYIFTDYTAYEAHFISELMFVTQGELFKYMLPPVWKVENCDWWLTYMNTVAGKNKLSFKFFDAALKAVRMSGEMDTSVSNGFTNLMLFLFTASNKGALNVVGFVEGDDGLFKVTPASAAPTAEDFAQLGFTIKIEHTSALSEASFCGQVYDMTDLIVVTDPVEVISRIGWTNKKYTRANMYTRMYLLRAKGYSLVYQYNGCPILSRLGRRILELTEGIKIPEKYFASLDIWERAKLRAATTAALPDVVEPGNATRSLVERLYGVSIEKQLELESYMGAVQLGVHPLPFDNVPDSWRDYYDRYSLDHLVDDPCWLLRPETELLGQLSKYKCCARFLRSL